MLHPAYAANVQGTDVNAGHEQPPEPEIAGESGIVMEASTGVVLFEKNMHDVYYPASITKIMTALLAIENCKMDEIVTVPPEQRKKDDYLRYILFGGIIAAAAAGCLLLKQKYQNRD